MNITELDYLVNTDADVNCDVIGNENTPIIHCDNTLVSCRELIGYALNYSDFKSSEGGYYPGPQASLPLQYVKNIVRAAVPLIQKVYKPICKQIKVRSSFFSYVATPPEELKMPQCFPHIDSSYCEGFAILHYLKSGHFGGTGFYRHKSTGYEKIDLNRAKNFSKIWSDEQKIYDLPKSQYFTQSDDRFELIKAVEYEANRIVIYPSNILHTGLINPDVDVHHNLSTSRLTANIFLDFK